MKGCGLRWLVSVCIISQECVVLLEVGASSGFVCVEDSSVLL